MPSPHLLSRRAALKCAAVSALALPLLSSRAAEPAPAAGPPSDRMHGIKLSVATISLRHLAVPAVAAVLNQLDIRNVSIFREHAPFGTGTPGQCRAVAEIFRHAGIHPAATSVIDLKNDEASARRAFENVRAAGLSLMTCSPTPDSLPLMDKLVAEYDIRLAIHNHGPEDKIYPSPYEAFKLVQSHDSRIGLCLDVGHAMRAHADPAEAIRRCASRVYDVHLKDSLAQPGAEDIPVAVGRGHMDIRGILAALIEIKYSGVVAFEYEKTEGDPALGLAESVGYVRGLLAAM